MFSTKTALDRWDFEEDEHGDEDEREEEEKQVRRKLWDYGAAAFCSEDENVNKRNQHEQQQQQQQKKLKRAKRDESPQASQTRDLDQLMTAFQNKWRTKSLAKAKTVEAKCVQHVEETARSVRQVLINTSNANDEFIEAFRKERTTELERQAEDIKRLRSSLEAALANDDDMVIDITSKVTGLHRLRRDNDKAIAAYLKQARLAASAVHSQYQHSAMVAVQAKAMQRQDSDELGRLQAALMAIIQA